jgi:putative transcriptional regulator
VSDSLRGKLLVASPALLDPNFERTVVLICAHDAQGAFGLVLNRPIEQAPVIDHVSAWAEWVPNPAVVFLGGPVEPTTALALGQLRAPEDTPILENVGLVDLSRRPDESGVVPGAARLYAGYSGWGGGQLESELAGNSWFVVDPDVQDVFSEEPLTLWQRVLRRQGGKLAMFANFPRDVRVN